MFTRAVDNGITTRYFVDDVTGEIIGGGRMVYIDDDFIGAGHSAPPVAGTPTAGYAWVTRIVKSTGNPTVSGVSLVVGGVMQMALDATSEKQEATLYQNDARQFDLSTRQLIFGCRLALTVLPSAAAVEMVWGLMGTWIDGPDNNAFYARFQCLANGAVNCQTKDGVNTTSNASGVTFAAGVFHTFMIDVASPTNVQFQIDGKKCPIPQVGFVATGANALLQPYFSVYKASGVGLGTMQLDAVQVGAER